MGSVPDAVRFNEMRSAARGLQVREGIVGAEPMTLERPAALRIDGPAEPDPRRRFFGRKAEPAER